MPNPPSTYSEASDIEKGLLLAADTRSRNASNILFVDEYIPDIEMKESGFISALDFLSMIAYQGHRITLVTHVRDNDESATEVVNNLGVEYYKGDFSNLALTRAGFYNVVLVRQQIKFDHFWDQLWSLNLECPFALVFDTHNKIQVRPLSDDEVRFPQDSFKDFDVATSCKASHALMEFLTTKSL